jgi:biopolymer transport protein TolR
MSKFSRKNGRRKPMAEINVVPYIDVTLVLLIIFMVTTPMLQTGVEVDLPEANSKPVESESTGSSNLPIVVSITEAGQYYIQIDGADDVSVQPEDISAQVMAALNSKPKTQVMIRADKKVDYGTVVTVMAKLKDAGVPAVGLVTEPEDK